jgi:hypothetical protein
LLGKKFQSTCKALSYQVHVSRKYQHGSAETFSHFLCSRKIQADVKVQLKYTRVDINKKPILLLRSSTRDILANDVGQGPAFDNHQQTLCQLIQQLQCTLPTNFHLFWKSATTVHVLQVQGDGLFHVAQIKSNTWHKVEFTIYTCIQKKSWKVYKCHIKTFYNATYLSAAQ